MVEEYKEMRINKKFIGNLLQPVLARRLFNSKLI